MNPERLTLAQLRDQAAQARRMGRYLHAAQRERQAVEQAEKSGLTGERVRALLWEGYSWWHAGEDDQALAVLLQALHEPATRADPADRFSALTTLLHISLEHKTARFCRALLEQGRREIEAMHQPWSALLDFLEGELAFRQGDFVAAGQWHERAWAGYRNTHPCLTPATHLWARCRTAFRCCQPAALAQLTQTLIQLSPGSALEQQLVMRARWLDCRAHPAMPNQPDLARSAPIEAARAFLAMPPDAHPLRDFGTRLDALRVLALAGDWPHIDAHLHEQPLLPDTFDTALLLGDLALGRARAAMGRAAVDDDYGTTGVETIAMPPIPDPNRAATQINEADFYYQEAKQWAEQQDQRLDTGWHSHLVQQRYLSLKMILL